MDEKKVRNVERWILSEVFHLKIMHGIDFCKDDQRVNLKPTETFLQLFLIHYL